MRIGSLPFMKTWAAVCLLMAACVTARAEAPKFERVAFESAGVASAGYDDQARVLEIEFPKGKIYRYQNVPREVFDALLKAKSKGRYFHAAIRGKYPHEAVAVTVAGE